MQYLTDLGFNEEKINVINKSLPPFALEILEKKKDNVIANIKYLKDLEISNYQTAFIRFYSMFLLSPVEFDEIFNKYDREDLIAKLEKNVAIMEYL